jgi:DNA-binding NtrC family response regulator
MPTVLCIDEEPTTGVMLEDALNRIGHQAIVASSFKEGVTALSREGIDLIISDHRVSDGAGRDVLDHIRDEGHDIPVIITTGYASVESAVLSMRRGAADYLTKPFRFEALRIAVNNALEVCKLRRDNEGFQKEIQFRRSIIGQSKRVRSLMETIAAVAPTRATVLLEGESGTGKELLARAIHDQSPRAGQAFVTINCAALPEGLVESTLFGHERGAFTGATSRSIGAFERAHRGTLVLDEISEMRLDLQAKLLRVVQEQEFERVGGGQRVKVDVRLIATTNRDLEAEVEAGRFRRDLYYRLSVVPVHTPPLRERLEDVPLLVQHFVDQYAKELGLRKPEISNETIDLLMERSWPGNVRELENAVGRAMILSRDNRITPAAFCGSSRSLSTVPASSTPEPDAPAATLPTLDLKSLEKAAIELALQQTGGHRARAARLLGISERTLRNKLNGRNGDGDDA